MGAAQFLARPSSNFGVIGQRDSRPNSTGHKISDTMRLSSCRSAALARFFG